MNRDRCHANDTENQAQQVAGNPHQRRFSTKTPIRQQGDHRLMVQ